MRATAAFFFATLAGTVAAWAIPRRIQRCSESTACGSTTYSRIGRPGERGAGSSHNVGAEVDLIGKWQLDPHTALSAGYAHFFPGSFVSETGRDGAADFFYGMVQYTF